jgi:hypothetical protein
MANVHGGNLHHPDTEAIMGRCIRTNLVLYYCLFICTILDDNNFSYSIHNNPSIVVYFTVKSCIFDFLILFFRIENYALIFISIWCWFKCKPLIFSQRFNIIIYVYSFYRRLMPFSGLTVHHYEHIVIW